MLKAICSKEYEGSCTSPTAMNAKQQGEVDVVVFSMKGGQHQLGHG